MNKDNRITHMTLKQSLLFVTYTVALITAMFHLSDLYDAFMKLVQLIRPFVYGFAIAYVFHLPMKYFMRKLPEKIKKGRALLSAACSLLLIFVVIAFLFQIVVPTVGESIMTLIESFPAYIKDTQQTLVSLLERLDMNEQILYQINQYSGQIQESVLNVASNLIPALINMTAGITSSIANLFLSVVIAAYLIISKQTLIIQVKRFLYAFTPKRFYESFLHVARLSDSTFSSFISGQMVEAVIIGILCYIGCLILKIPYAPIVSVVIGCTNIIPIFGPIIGTVICAFLIMFVSPLDALIFVIFGICLQQFESNLIYPKVVGSSVGLSGLWVLFAITIGGGLFGLTGMVLGLPSFAVLYTLLKEEMNRRLSKKQDAQHMQEDSASHS